jgi:hypothetical protein
MAWLGAWLGVVLAAGVGGDVGVSDLRTALEMYDGSAVHKAPKLTDAQLQALVDGACVRVLMPNEDPDGPSAATGMVLSSVPRSDLWIAAQDPHTVVDPDLTEFIVDQVGPDEAIWYGYWDLPRPVKDRQWVVRSYNNHDLAQATDNRAWEHVWSLVPDGLEQVRPMVDAGRSNGVGPAQLDDAIFTPVNKGSWFMVAVGEHTLLGYQATSVVGGAVPDWLVARLAMARLESVLRGVEDRARTWVGKHYTGSHVGVYGGDGKHIPR